ncbi:hypothetical protein BpHYR1_001756 [Brachionus plicatilis]|uniref:Uncharacterized protein n=1 Tax=Brachionus plicatilis TaxID=10195 RepID=A0A3M7SM60_BRAPC|nr:hypothetical protein BpHYR1_001756 [Brachionus plicatilis]
MIEKMIAEKKLNNLYLSSKKTNLTQLSCEHNLSFITSIFGTTEQKNAHPIVIYDNYSYWWKRDNKKFTQFVGDKFFGDRFLAIKKMEIK